MAPDYLSPNFLNKEKIQECVREFQKLGFPQCFAAIAKLHSIISPHKYNRNWLAYPDQVIFLSIKIGK